MKTEIDSSLLEGCIDLMKCSPAVYLTTLNGDGYPETRAMLNLWNAKKYPSLENFLEREKDSFNVYFTTNVSSVKHSQIKENSKVSVYYCQPSRWKGLMLSGDIEIVTEMKIKKALWQPLWTMYYPRGAEDPDYAILRLVPKWAKFYHKLKTESFVPGGIGGKP